MYQTASPRVALRLLIKGITMMTVDLLFSKKTKKHRQLRYRQLKASVVFHQGIDSSGMKYLQRAIRQASKLVVSCLILISAFVLSY